VYPIAGMIRKKQSPKNFDYPLRFSRCPLPPTVYC
jgi:hypothetical protein